MKALTTGIFFILTALLLGGCIKDNLDDCPTDEYELILIFEYRDSDGKDVFAERIQTIDVIIYDQQRNVHSIMNFDDVIADEQRYRSVDVEPGIYYIVSWANNVNSRQDMSVITDDVVFGTNYLFHTQNNQSTDQLHFAPDLSQVSGTRQPDDLTLFAVTVQATGTTYHTISYMSAYRTVNVYLKGFSEVGNDQLQNPTVLISNLSDNYNDLLERGSDNMSFNKRAEDTIFEIEDQDTGLISEQLLGFASFYVPHFDNESPVTIDISGPVSGNHTLTMNHVLEELGMVVKDGDCAVIPIYLELIDGAWVQVSLPEWLVENVTGEFNKPQ